ncbi:hypothetical protein pdul_cds_421 [Pandoravirus dulcis]|uniref:Uncharacterized protein n=1 Tax=Pandoravirus dulcis TaxID=1349409 RepID=A0A291AU74_9VIRU|nr:hypothetical protein pdul_cds_421 [Pandoravirus dulcis]ATE82505.1 hypothetical protein pdul_cds_421 [Pandoravirus dulcis]
MIQRVGRGGGGGNPVRRRQAAPQQRHGRASTHKKVHWCNGTFVSFPLRRWPLSARPIGLMVGNDMNPVGFAYGRSCPGCGSPVPPPRDGQSADSSAWRRSSQMAISSAQAFGAMIPTLQTAPLHYTAYRNRDEFYRNKVQRQNK